MSDREYSLDDLVRETGFSKRQIRFYITKRLIPGAGDSRGPNATYAEQTLQRLLLIRDLKDRPVGPTGRTMTLDEIGHMLDSLAGGSVAGASAMMIGGPRPSFEAEESVVTRRFENDESIGSASEYLNRLRESDLGRVTSSMDTDKPAFLAEISLCRASLESDEPRHDLSDLLGRLQALLAELGSDTRFTPTAGEAGQWLRVTTPDVEFHVRKPDDHVARVRLARLARELARLLEREE